MTTATIEGQPAAAAGQPSSISFAPAAKPAGRRQAPSSSGSIWEPTSPACSQIRGIDTLFQKKLADDGHEVPKVRPAGQDFLRYVAIGALKAACAARENQRQVLLG
jgi:hypothetical protein